jgi:hypothetical protein
VSLDRIKSSTLESYSHFPSSVLPIELRLRRTKADNRHRYQNGQDNKHDHYFSDA